jgi:rubrerythrin
VNQWHSTDEALDFAIGEEKVAAKLYTRLADQVKMPGM